ncbi:uncharacterized protein [Watersipora subatra]|uniref:uncharacterized protein n=1 Tax=Watersipora subatra TaxID=2589382 RepID=UPI00355B67F5
MAGIASSSSSSSEDLNQTGGVNSVDALLQRRKCELMYELKKIQHGERPVTGSDSREKVGSFFSKRVQPQDSPVANVDDVEEHRPQQVTIEVQGLLQTRSVSSMLQSVQFRRSLENAVRSHLGGSASRRPRETVRPAEQATATAQLNSTVPIPPSGSPPSVVNEEPAVSAIARHEAAQPFSRQPVNAQPVNAQPVNAQPVNAQQSSGDAEVLMRQLNHDNFVMEISELVHRQIVSSTLRGDFRDRLERHVGRRIAESGRDGHAVQEQILRLPPSGIIRNDFSHLGIPAPHDQQQIDDAVSVISATASATIPYAQSNAAVQREMSAMKAQIAQLSNMLKMSLDLQMDIQRSIRQEVAAAVSQASVSNTVTNAATVPTTQLRSQRANDSKCIVCIEDDADAVLYRCGHICICYSCALRMRSANGNCPVCRAPISDILRAYRISNEL